MQLTTEDQKRIIDIYKKLFQYQHLLTEVDPFPVTEDEQLIPQVELVHSHVRKVMGYLLDLNPDSLDASVMIKNVDAKYERTTFWFQVVADYIEVLYEFEKRDLEIEGKKKIEPLKQSKEEIDLIIKTQRELIQQYSKPIKEAGFLVDAEKLIKNYLNWANEDPDKAWEVLTTNPAYFSSILVFNKEGKRVLSPSSAKKMNSDLGLFIKNLKL